MSRRVPEFALVVGVFLGLSAAVFGVALGWTLYATVVVAAVGAYPFVAFGLLRDDDPASVVPPSWVLLGGAAWGSLGAVGVLVGDPSPSSLPFAAAVGLALALPAAAYAVVHDAGVNPLSPRATLLVAVAAAAGLLAVGLLVGAAVFAVVDAVVVGVAAGLYAAARGVRFGARTRRTAVALGAAVGVALVAVSVARGDPLGDWVLAGTAVAFAPALYAALSRDGRRRGRRRRRR